MKRLFAVSAILVSPYFTVQSHAADWPRFRGPGGRATSADKGLPLTWSATKNIAWKTKLPGHGSSSPITVGNRIFLTSFSGYGLSANNPGDRSKLMLHVVCLDRESGKIVWDESIRASDAEQKVTRRVAGHGYATPTPVSDGEAVYAFFGASGVVAYDMQGKQMWTAEAGSKTAGFGFAASPILYKNLVIVNASIESSTLFAFDKKTGKEVWRADGINRAWTTPTIVDVPGGKPELVVNQKETIFGFDPETGKKLWSCVGIQDYVVPCVIQHEDVIYCLGGRSNRCIAVRVGGRRDVTETHKLWEVNLGANVTSPVYHEGHLYWASDKGVAYCLDAKTGATVYRERLPARSRIYASVVLAEGRLYVTTRDVGVIVLKAAPEYEQLAQNVIEGDDNLFNASPAISNGQLLLRNHEFLYCVGKGR